MVGLSSYNGQNYRRKSEEDASIFASIVGRPALGKTFTHMIDTSIFLSSIPKSREDAEIAYGGTGSTTWQTAKVLEVVNDRYGNREGRWATFEIFDKVELRSLS